MASAGASGRQKRESASNGLESLISHETMDRSSPEMWPREIPGMGEFASIRENFEAKRSSADSRNRVSKPADFRLMQQLSMLSAGDLIMEVKKLHDMAYQLGVDEAKEMTRGKYLNIFQTDKCRR